MPMICSDCNGSGVDRTPTFVRFSNAQSLRFDQHTKCYRCRGEGTVPDEMAGWIARGQELRSARLAEGRTLRAEAERLGITPTHLSQMEQGLVAPMTEAPT